MAIKSHLPNGEEVDMVTNSLKFFPVSNGTDFRDLFLAVAASPPDAPKPTKFEQFAAAHPTVAAAVATVATPAALPRRNTTASTHSCSSTRAATASRCVI